MMALVSLKSFGQGANLVGSFLNLDPGVVYTYQADAFDWPPGSHSWGITWGWTGRDSSYEPTAITRNGVANGQITIKWSNDDNTKSFKPTLKWKIDATSYEKVLSVTNITINHVGTPASMNIGGTVKTNGQSIDRPCGVGSPVTVTIPAVTTKPVGLPVTYIFTFPSGWSPASVTTTSTSATSTPSAGGAGAIKVQAKITGQTYTSQIQVTVNRPQPTISSISTSLVSVCSDTETKPVTVVGTNAGQFIWTPSGGTRINGSSSPVTTTSATANIGAVSDGSFSVRAYSTACAVQSTSSVSAQTKRLSLPNRNLLMYDGSNPAQTYTHQVSSYDNHFVSFYTADAVTINWNPIWSSGPQQGSPGVNRYDFILQPYQTLDFSPLQITNQCGTLSTITSFQGIGPWLMSAYPNPASDVINIQMLGSEKAEKLPESAKLYSEKSGKVVKNVSFSKEASRDNILKIGVSDLPRGTYYLEVIDEKSDVPAKKTRIVLN